MQLLAVRTERSKVKNFESELIQKERVAQPQFQLSVTRTGAEDSA